MKLILNLILIAFSIGVSNSQIAIDKTELKSILRETLKKSQNPVYDASNNWRYNNTNQDYFDKDKICFKHCQILSNGIL